ncbi:MAG: hypothetical protein EA350_10570 [Gemmatimonadales bacterium]|nr:MAG: hypothetical protein EA350_10570 [Gemmatimonadales bacterium]
MIPVPTFLRTLTSGLVLACALAACSEAGSMTLDTPDPPGPELPPDPPRDSTEICGIAASFPGDQGIAAHPSVLFHEDFEHGSMGRLAERFSSIRNPGRLDFVDSVSAESSGERALRMTAVGGAGTGAHLFRSFDGGHNLLHLRYYIRYDTSHVYHHTGGTLGGYNPPTPWPQGGAGSRPGGADKISIRFEPMSRGRGLDFYTYWMEMRGNPGDSSFWGNTFLGGARPPVPHREWVAVEFMVRLNDPADATNGELALWLDGEPVLHLRPGDPRGRWVWDTFHPDPQGEPFPGFQWRNADNLGLNWLWFSHYVTGQPEGEVSEVWWDDIVLATEYIGPIGGSPCP